ncbi:hypothetical protein ACWEKM_15170 [Streptomyces sp. NPDC004752]
MAFVPALCFVLVLVFGHAALPFQRIVTIEAKMASKSEFFEDPEVERLLLQHGFRMHITRMGSRGIATQSYQGYDVVFPSGQPAADLITQERARAGHPATTYGPFSSPIVLATYREYAKTLVAAGVARPQQDAASDGDQPLYYRLDMRRFIELAQADGGKGKRWDDIGLGRYGLHNGNKVLAQTSDICESNSAGTYLGLVAFVENGNDIPKSEAEADQLAERIKPVLIAQGMPSFEKNQTYLSPEGKSIAPIAVIYEHQFLAHQIQYRAKTGAADDERVLLYPSTRFITEPKLIALSDDGDRLGRLISDDPVLQERAMELGFRLRDANSGFTSIRLTEFLKDHHIPAPAASTDDTRAILPDLSLLERMIETVGKCDPTGSPGTGSDGSTPTAEGSS